MSGGVGVMSRIAPHQTGHERARDGTLLRVDRERGSGWVATHYDLSLRVIQVSASICQRVCAFICHPRRGRVLMGRYPKECTVTNVDPQLYGGGMVQVSLHVICPEGAAQEILNRIGEVT